jgi:hypothetical protein
LPLVVVLVADVGVFLVLIDHTSAATFDPDAVDLDSGNPLYRKLFALVPRGPTPLFYTFAGVPAASATQNLVLPFGGTILVPVYCFLGTQATADAIFTVKVISAGTPTTVGTIEVFASSTPNSANFNQTTPPITLLSNDVLQLVAPASPDATLANLSLTLLIQPT